MSRISTSSSGGNVNIQDTNGNPLTSTGGALDVNITSGGSTSSTLIFNEVLSVVPGLETTIISYTVPGPSTSILGISVSAQNIGEIRIYKNAQIIDKQYLYYTGFNLEFNFFGYKLLTNDVLSVKVVNAGEEPSTYSSKVVLNEAV